MDPVTIMAIAAGVQAAQGIGESIAAKRQLNQSEEMYGKARTALEGVRYADTNDAYFRALQSRVNVGLPTESRVYAEQQADRMMAAALYGGDRSGVGLAGIGAAQQSAADQYRKIAAMDADLRLKNLEAVQQEMGRRGEMTYQENMSLANLDLAEARALRQEAIARRQAGMQTAISGAANLGNTAIFAQQYGLNNFKLPQGGMSPVPVETGFKMP